MSFHYPLVAPQLLSPTVGPYTQQSAPREWLASRRCSRTRQGQITGSMTPQHRSSLRRNIAVVLGGSQGMAAMADRPGFRLSDWAVFTADDIIETRGYSDATRFDAPGQNRAPR